MSSLPILSYAVSHACSIDMERTCSELAAPEVNLVFVDMGLADNDVHTAFSANPEAASNAFVDFLFLMDATFIVRSKSSFSGVVCSIKGLRCQGSRSPDLVARHITLCMPRLC